MTTDREEFETYLREEAWLGELDEVDYKEPDIARMWHAWQAARRHPVTVTDDVVEKSNFKMDKDRIDWWEKSMLSYDGNKFVDIHPDKDRFEVAFGFEDASGKRTTKGVKYFGSLRESLDCAMDWTKP